MSDGLAQNPLTSRVEALLLDHGWEAGATQILGHGYEWFLHGQTGLVGYVDTGKAWIAAGAPVAPTTTKDAVARAFVEQARRRGRRACFFGSEGTWQHSVAFERLILGEQPEWHPRTYLRQHLKRSLREQHRRARAKGLRVREATRQELDRGRTLRAAFERLVERWLATRRMAPLDFVVAVEPEFWSRPFAVGDATHRIFAVEGGLPEGLSPADNTSRLRGAALLLPVPRRRGWFLKHLLRDPEAPNGTIELLVHEILRTLAEEDAAFATLGLSPLAGDVHPTLKLARRAFGPAFDFEGLYRFKAKLAPTTWSPVHLTYPKGSSAALALYDSLGAFAPQGRFRFAIDTVVRKLGRGPVHDHRREPLFALPVATGGGI